MFRRDMKAKARIVKIVPALILRYSCIGFIFLLVRLSRLGDGVLAFFLAEALLVLLFTPGVVCEAFSGDLGRKDICNLTLTRLNSISIILGKLAGANFYNLVVVILSAIIIFARSLSVQRLSILGIMFANLALLILMFASSVVGVFSSILLFFKNLLASSMLAYIVIFLLLGSIIIPGPVIERVQHQKMRNAIIKIALYINPLIMVSRSLGNIDIMRTEYIYTLADPVVGRGFTYPNWGTIGIIICGISCFLLIPTFIMFDLRIRKHPCDGG